jgi:preprotein translocase subunit YajC
MAMWMWQSGGLFSSLGTIGGLAPILLFFVALYFLMIVPNQRKQKAWQEMLGGLKSGDKVTTSGGIRGTVMQVKEDVVTLRIQPDGIKMEFVKSAISAVSTPDDKA